MYYFAYGFVIALCLIATVAPCIGAEVVLPQTRHAYYCNEPIEIAIAQLTKDAIVELKPQDAGATAFTFTAKSNGSTATYRLAPMSLAPGRYQIIVDDVAHKQLLTISRGLHSSTMYVSQTGDTKGDRGGSNFNVANAFTFGLVNRDGTPSTDLRRMSRTLGRYDSGIAEDIPALCYLYWTGYVLHKPWGIHKEWVSEDMIENMRLFNFHVAQRLRKYQQHFLCIGTIDEPGLPWGRTAGGGAASGFSGWNTAPWLKQHGFDWTDNPGALSDKEYLQYMELRSLMLREPQAQASADIKAVWPDAVFATDLYAPQAVGDGTDPMNQIVNDIPTTHVFADYGIGKLGVLAGMYVEKAHDPLSKVAHAMNGQLFGDRVRHPGSLYAYHLMQNVLLAAGLDSNWWLNYAGLGIDADGKNDAKLRVENLMSINEPAARIGPVFREMTLSDHDVAVLWSNTEIRMRAKPIMIKEADKKHGEQISLMIADLPEDTLNEDGSFNVNLYSIGGNYKGEVMTAFMAINRAGYPTHVIHEQRLPDGVLDQYKVLVIVGQTHAMPPAVMDAIAAFTKAGGKVVVDQSTTVPFDSALKLNAPSVVGQGYQWMARFSSVAKAKDAGDKARAYSYYGTNHFMEQFGRDAVAPVKSVLAQTDARQVMQPDTVELGCERHVAGEGQMVMLINGHEKLPDIADTEQYPIWNYAPLETICKLPGVADSDVVYCIEGLDWKTSSRVTDATEARPLSFAPGEMKLYLIAPREPGGLVLKVESTAGTLEVRASLKNLKMPWPLAVDVRNPAGETLVHLYRSTDADGEYHETIPLGVNALAGEYVVSISSPVAELAAESVVLHQPNHREPQVLDDAARVFDADAIRMFFASKPKLVIAFGDVAHQPLAERFAASLNKQGIVAVAKPESQVWSKALYPRVWDPYMSVTEPTGNVKALPDGIEQAVELNIESHHYDTPTVTTADGQPFEGDWKVSGTVLTVGAKGFVDMGRAEAFYEPGCRIAYVPGDANNPKRTKLMVLDGQAKKVKSDEAFRAKWARPWKKLSSYFGGHNLVPQAPEAYAVDDHVILMGDSKTSELVRVIQASELLMQVADEKYPGDGKALVSYVWSPFKVGRNAVLIAGTSPAGLAAGVDACMNLAK